MEAIRIVYTYTNKRLINCSPKHQWEDSSKQCQVHFKVRFDAKDFLPEDIEVTTVDNHLRVHAKKSIKSGNSTTVREFHRSVDLPRSIDHENFQCHMTEVRLILFLIFIVKYN
ncbi:unnamed protein product [Schistosoma mattheei]|uniref:Uncharacterized protein n=1 Tax=Schistosoma mattheei TaxID=31246 RepID=A0A183NJK7_9TREM|nr:unnamed protein product [Schistosoma mattheei]